ncbi:MAG TPA: divalent metal cation transporter, partial [Chloroflexota bacterium]|nr:divalent metal cation transporter [Chloroflexota bacterium]
MRRPRRRDPPETATHCKTPPHRVPSQDVETQGPSWLRFLRFLGPGLMAGLADNDPAGLATYAIAGAVAGYSQLWLLVVATIMVQAVQVTSAKLGDVTQQGLLRLTRVRYGWTLAACIGLIAVVANQASLIADTAGIGASLQLLTGLSWQWFVVPSSLILMTITIFFRFREIFIAYLAAGTLTLAYLVTAFLTHPNWGAVLHGT